MAERFMFGIAQNILGKLGSLALDEVLLAWGLKSDLQSLHNTLSSIQAVLLDAEEQQANNYQLEDWLGKLKDVIYEIDEVLDDFEIKALQQKFRIDQLLDGTRPHSVTSALRTLDIGKCASLLSLPQGLRYLTALENLVIADCENLELMFNGHAAEDVARRGGGLKSLQYLEFWKLPKLVGFPQWLLQGSDCNTLKHIRIGDCPNFTTLPDWMTENLKSLQKLWIYKCPQLKSLSKGMHRLTALTEIRIWKSTELMSRCQRETGEDWLEIAHVPHIYLDGIKI